MYVDSESVFRARCNEVKLSDDAYRPTRLSNKRAGPHLYLSRAKRWRGAQTLEEAVKLAADENSGAVTCRALQGFFDEP